MTSAVPRSQPYATLPVLPTDLVRQLMWRFAGRPDLQQLVLSTRRLARQTVARVVAQGGRETQEWTADKQQMLEAFDQAGITGLSAGRGEENQAAGAANLAAALAAFELAWVDGGAAACSSALRLAQEPIAEAGTSRAARALPRAPPVGSDREASRPSRVGPFASPNRCRSQASRRARCPAESASRSGRTGRSRCLEVQKRGRFTTNMDFANFVVATVASDDPRIQGTCMVILEEGDPRRIRPRARGPGDRPPTRVDSQPDVQCPGARLPNPRRLHDSRRCAHSQLSAT